MKIDITTDEGKRIFLWFPTSLLLNRLTVAIGVAYINKSKRNYGIPKLSYSLVMPLVKEIHRQRRIQGRKWTLVDVVSADGEGVKIIL
ncbi:MAG: hypothetical protein IJB43_01450 [Clostridia bacterium]|nr:hypothetical protein [Clostridia bacterium]